MDAANGGLLTGWSKPLMIMELSSGQIRIGAGALCELAGLALTHPASGLADNVMVTDVKTE